MEQSSTCSLSSWQVQDWAFISISQHKGAFCLGAVLHFMHVSSLPFLFHPVLEQVKASGRWDPVSSPPSQRSSAENILAGSCHGAHIGHQRKSLGTQSPCPSTPELLQPQTPPSPESARQSRSVLSLCALSSEGNGPSEEPSGSLPASTGVPSPVATTATWGAEGRALQRQEPLGPLLDYRSTVGLIREISSYQADYWACAIPDSLPPSPDRSSPHWNPNKEYEDLLDYAYPLKPRYRLGRMREPFLHDSGIALDSFSSSPEGTSRSTSIYGRAGQAQGSRENGFLEFMASADRFSTPKHGRRGCSGAGLYYEPSPIAKASSHPSRGFTKDVRVESAGLNSTGYSAANRRSWAATGNPCPNYTGQAKSTNRFLPTTGVLPLRKDWEAEEEFLSLPPRLQELERLAQFLSNLSLTIRTPGHDHHNLPHHSTSRQPLASRLAPFGEARGRDERENIEGHAGLWQCRSSQKDPLRGLHLPAGLRDTLDGLYLHEPRFKGHPKKSQQSESLVHCVKMFCCQLEELIRWLYNVAYVTGSWVPPSPDAESVSASLHRYLVGSPKGLWRSSAVLWMGFLAQLQRFSVRPPISTSS
uniref:Centrosomal protein 68 n=1 Tax=Malurus cyaneus samueli TaxID=2593467 RepID=A0A8C5X0P5_9PASS